jgi:hypothetical protein
MDPLAYGQVICLSRPAVVDELDIITEALRRQRKDLEGQIDETLSRKSDTAALLGQIEELRARTERTQQAYQAQADESAAAKTRKKK